ncbi:hypothetical protein DPEC_G00291130 [Dallia pectoralis]|uniref:Uncharacterized protein n=1 Tax=Dallia pectoralis TaxID=75939 RepID=A0ACC2FHN8_DALPE|nr:hypothetical protein DPEC_G00291130 [Dallia pectoralis]
MAAVMNTFTGCITPRTWPIGRSAPAAPPLDDGVETGWNVKGNHHDTEDDGLVSPSLGFKPHRFDSTDTSVSLTENQHFKLQSCRSVLSARKKFTSRRE